MTETLFDIDARTGADVTHVLLPNMAYACGGSVLTKRGTFQVGIAYWPAIDCPDCRAVGESVIRDEISGQQGRQADVS